jgi:crotonobetainyl-CoA:carnitine CoA-transferase CaiB-like acyl-CoA transferase
MKAFAGVRIVEFAQVIAGPFATALLGQLGADVIKVEPPGTGDQARRLMDTGPLAEANMAPLFQGMNAGKRSIALDLKHPAAMGVVRRLVERANAVVENSRPGVMERLGLGYEALRAVRPGLVYCSVSGFGQTGPRRDAPAYDGAIQAASGMMSVNGNEGDGPLKVGFAVSDGTAALMTAFALSSALYRQAVTGEGQYLDVSMFDSSLWMLSPLVTNYLIGGDPPRQLGNSSLTQLPTANVFPTKGGHLQISAITQPQVRLLWETLGRPDIVESERYAGQARQLEQAAELRDILVGVLAGRDAAEWEAILNAAGVPASRVLTVPEAIEFARAAGRGTVLEFPARDGLPPSFALNAGFVADRDGPGASAPAPYVGEHTDAILAELGYAPGEVVELRATGAI